MTSADSGDDSRRVAAHQSDSLSRIIRRRRMTRQFHSGPALEDIVEIAELSLRAPSAGFSQGVHLIVLTAERLQEFWDRSRAGSWFAGRAPGVLEAEHVVLVFGNRDEYLLRYAQDDKKDLGWAESDRWHTPYWLVDAGMVVQNFLLLVEERRWGALFFGVDGDQGEYFDDLGVPQAAQCVGAIAIGYRSDRDSPSGSSVTRSRRRTNEVVHIGRWLAAPLESDRPTS